MRPPTANAAPPEAAGSLWNDRVFLALAAGSLVLKLSLAVLAAGIEPVMDERSYLHTARELAGGAGFDTNFRPPLYIGLLSGVLAVGGTPDTARLLQAVLATLCLMPLYVLGRAVGGRRAARVATALVACDPVLNGFAHLQLEGSALTESLVDENGGERWRNLIGS